MLQPSLTTDFKLCAAPYHDGPNPLPCEMFACSKGRLSSYCKICATIKARAWYADNLERARAYHAARREEKHEQIKVQQRARWSEQADELNERRRQRYEEDPLPAQISGLTYRQSVRKRVFDHYGQQCACCGSKVQLQIDHVDGNGTQHRRQLFGDSRGASGTSFYIWLIRNDFPECFQTLCHPCNASKRTGAHCRLKH